MSITSRERPPNACVTPIISEHSSTFSSSATRVERSASVELLNVVVPGEVNGSSIHANPASSEVHSFLESLGMDQYKASFRGYVPAYALLKSQYAKTSKKSKT
ncbi:hypothetical protein TELCIR_17591 [Teladorsagia circumcincta]|uniref:Uncharacterized protein n=1 Tax=Teladorsagia circumcincta TaxID=45464 RepID=A0A2G9TSB2_TELCI|nr:hypothetical protein TELCIR_17591 [Teladorsagia circumcincta]